ncbi:MAG: PP2C family serine/threonine-protein phosphatase [Candidatus Dormibacteria bacterium]
MTDTGGEVAVQAGAWSLIGAGATDRGPVRAENQDCFRLVPHGSAGLGLLLADGMGGHSGGREAAEAAVSGAADRLAAPGGEEQLREALAVANAAVAGVRLQLGGNPGTTMVAAVIEEGRLTLAHAGDSRAYLVRDGEAAQLTSDHSLTGERVRAGTLDPETARHDPRRNYVTRALLGDPVQPDVSGMELISGDVVVLCTDGLWEPLTDGQIAGLAGGDVGPVEGSQRLVAAALAAGATDNVTAVVARIDST